jgi:hypothetical protein
MAGAFGVGDEADKQNPGIGPTGRIWTEPVPPQTKRLPGAQLVRCHADDVGVFAWLRYKLEIMQPDLIERQLTRSHVLPTS